MSKIHVILIHGTWAGSARWTHPGSVFREELTRVTQAIGYEEKPFFDTFDWDGRLKARSRKRTVRLLKKHVTALMETNSDCHYLLVAHSHGGNIATDALRNILEAKSEAPIYGVICLNTPFYTHEVRGVNAYLLPWFFIGMFLSVMLNVDRGANGSLGPALIPPNFLVPALYWITGALAFLCIVGKLFRQPPYAWKPKPNVLCLSCPDDEAITFLGLGEGVSNLPQLFLHPIGLVFAIIGVGLLLQYSGVPISCASLDCWQQRLFTAAESFVVWVGLALAGGLLGASAVTFMFGLPIHHLFKTLVSRMLVSYTPLSPANTFFRAIPVQFRLNPMRLFHSSIYYSPHTFTAIKAWLQRDQNT